VNKLHPQPWLEDYCHKNLKGESCASHQAGLPDLLILLVCFSKIFQSLSSFSLLAHFCAVLSATPHANLPDLAALNKLIPL
jgi:hypothetical protein